MAGATRDGVVLEVVADGAPPRAGNAGFCVESPPEAGALLKRDGVCDCGPPVAAPNNGLGVVSAAPAGLPNRPPAFAVAADPAPPNRLLGDGEAVAAVNGAAEAGFVVAKRLLGA